MEIVYDEEDLRNYMRLAVLASPEHPVLIDKFLSDAIEIDVDVVADGTDVFIGGVMEHIEEAGIHSGDSAMSLPTFSIADKIVKKIKEQSRQLALELGVVGLMNVQFALKNGEVYILEVNPRASRTVPFVSKAIGVPLAKIAARVMTGEKLKDMGLPKEIIPKHISVKESVFPFAKFPGTDILLGPEMRSTGEVMGIDNNFGRAFYKAQVASGLHLPHNGTVFVSVRDSDKEPLLPVARKLVRNGLSYPRHHGDPSVSHRKRRARPVRLQAQGKAAPERRGQDQERRGPDSHQHRHRKAIHQGLLLHTQEYAPP